ncbi:MAG: hypothetical protein O3A00_11130 [Planctomycetota bacterium]|nr:hypothetical protein [Planctomycetota bacterium]
MPVPPVPHPQPTQQEYQFTGLLAQKPTSEPPAPPPSFATTGSIDNFDDLVVGIPLYDEAGSLDAGFDAGAVQIFFGSNSGPLENVGQHITLNGVVTRRSPGGGTSRSDLRGTPTRGENFGGGAEYPYFTPDKMIAPLSGAAGEDWNITGFADLDVSSGVANYLGSDDRVTDGSVGTRYTVSNANGATVLAPTNARVEAVALSSGIGGELAIVDLDLGDGWTARMVMDSTALNVSGGETLTAGDNLAALAAGQSVTFQLKYQSYDGSPTTVAVDPFLAPFNYFATPQDTSPPDPDDGGGDDGGGDMMNALDNLSGFYVYDEHEFAPAPANKPQDCIPGTPADAGWSRPDHGWLTNLSTPLEPEQSGLGTQSASWAMGISSPLEPEQAGWGTQSASWAMGISSPLEPEQAGRVLRIGR